MNKATFRFYADLNDFLPIKRRQIAFIHSFDGHPAIKDTIESLGVPHTEVAMILVNGEQVDFAYHLNDGDQVSIYPPSEEFGITSETLTQPERMGEARFVLDVHLGRLAAYLRMLGFDTLYQNDYDDPELARISQEEGRILLTRDRGLLKRSQVTHGYSVRHTNPRLQMAEVIRRYHLLGAIAPFKRCSRCNGLLKGASKEEVSDDLPVEIIEYYDDFRRCQQCGQVYWKGSHYDRMRALIEETLKQDPPNSGGGV